MTYIRSVASSAEALTGAPPFHGDTALNLMMEASDSLACHDERSFYGREFPEQLETIIAKSLIKDPNLRYQNFLDLARDLATLKEKTSRVDTEESIGLGSAGQ